MLGSLIIPWFFEKIDKINFSILLFLIATFLLISFILFFYNIYVIYYKIALFFIGFFTSIMSICFTGILKHCPAGNLGIIIGTIHFTAFFTVATIYKLVTALLKLSYTITKNSINTCYDNGFNYSLITMLVYIGVCILLAFQKLRKRH